MNVYILKRKRLEIELFSDLKEGRRQNSEATIINVISLSLSFSFSLSLSIRLSPSQKGVMMLSIFVSVVFNDHFFDVAFECLNILTERQNI